MQVYPEIGNSSFLGKLREEGKDEVYFTNRTHCAFTTPFSEADSGFSRGGATTPKLGLFCKFLPPGGGGCVPSAPP